MLAWPGMPADSALAEAAQRIGVSADVERVSSNERLRDLVAAGPPYDVIFPSDYMVEHLRARGMIVPVDRDALPLERLAEWAVQAEHDQGCEWSVPFAFGTTGYLCDTSRLGSPRSWSALFEPEPGMRVGMLDEVREVVGAALLATGHGPNDVSDAALDAARSLLERQRPSVARYDSDDFVTPVVSGELPIHHAWSGPAAHAVREHVQLRYVVPEEGATLWITSASVPSDAPDPARSHELIRELMDPALAARTTQLEGFATPNEEARRQLPSALREDRSLFPDAETLARCQAFCDLGSDEERLAAVFTPPRRV